MNFLILGCNGMAGHTISLYLKEQGHKVLGFDRQTSQLVESVSGDAMDQAFIKDLVGKGKFDSVINCIGLLNQFAENNKAGAVYLNSFLPHYLAQLTEGTDTQVIHMSTDCVFSGKRGQYTEDDFQDGTTFYDRSKALGELNDGKNLTLRQSIIGPDIKESGIGLLNWFLKQKTDIRGYSKVMWTGVTTLELAKVMEKAAKAKIHGLYNMVPASSISKYNLLMLFNEYLRKAPITIQPDDKMAVDKSLKRTNWTFEYQVKDYREMVEELGVWMKAHKNLYPHYLISE